jgi:hypothetical protein
MIVRSSGVKTLASDPIVESKSTWARKEVEEFG